MFHMVMQMNYHVNATALAGSRARNGHPGIARIGGFAGVLGTRCPWICGVQADIEQSQRGCCGIIGNVGEEHGLKQEFQQVIGPSGG